SVTDAQSWLGMKLKDQFEKLRPELVTYRDENRRELFDLPDIPLPDPDTPAPIRFLPEYDNILLSHSNRTRIIADEHRSKVYLPGLRVAATFLVDGFVAGVWRVEKGGGLVVEAFGAISNPIREALSVESELLLRFIEPNSARFELRL